MYDDIITPPKRNKKFIFLFVGIGILLLLVGAGVFFLAPQLQFINTMQYTHEQTIQGSWEVLDLTNCGDCNDPSAYYKFLDHTFTKYDGNKQVMSTGNLVISRGQEAMNAIDNNGERLDKIIQYLVERDHDNIDDIYVVRMTPTNAPEEVSIWKLQSNNQSQITADVFFQYPRYGKKAFDYDKMYMNMSNTAFKI